MPGDDEEVRKRPSRRRRMSSQDKKTIWKVRNLFSAFIGKMLKMLSSHPYPDMCFQFSSHYHFKRGDAGR